MAQQLLNPVEQVDDGHKKKGRQVLTCSWCYQYHGVRVLRHMVEACKHQPQPVGDLKDAAQSKINEMQESVRAYTSNMFFNPNDIEERMYSKAEVCHLLERWGHEAVSNEIKNIIKITPKSLPHVTYKYEGQALAARLSPAMHVNPAPQLPAMLEMPDELTMQEMPDELTMQETPDEDNIGAPMDTEYTQPEEEDNAGMIDNVDADSDSDADIQPVMIRTPKRKALFESPPSIARKTSGPKSSPYGYKRKPTYTKKKQLVNTIVYEKGCKAAASEAGWYALPADYLEQPLLKDFQQWYTVQGKNYENNIKNVARLMYEMGGKTGEEIDTKDLTLDNYRRCNYLMDGFAFDAQTLANYNKSLKHFLKFIINDSNMAMKQNNRLEYDRLKGVKNNVDLIFNGLRARTRATKKQEKSKASLPATPYDIQEVLRRGRKEFDRLMMKAETTLLTKTDVSDVNKYICCYICLTLANRPSVAENFQAAEFLTGITRPQLQDDEYQYYVISVADHKTSNQFDSHIVLDEYWKKQLDIYYTYIRDFIVRKRNSNVTNFLVQHDGKAFTKISNGIVKLQEKFKLNPVYNCTAARKSYETYFGSANEKIRKNVNDFLAHSTEVANTTYRAADTRKAVGTARAMRGVYRYYQDKDRLAPMPTDEDIEMGDSEFTYYDASDEKLKRAIANRISKRVDATSSNSRSYPPASTQPGTSTGGSTSRRLTSPPATPRRTDGESTKMAGCA